MLRPRPTSARWAGGAAGPSAIPVSRREPRSAGPPKASVGRSLLAAVGAHVVVDVLLDHRPPAPLQRTGRHGLDGRLVCRQAFSYATRVKDPREGRAEAARSERQHARRSRRQRALWAATLGSALPAIVVTVTEFFARSTAAKVLDPNRLLGIAGLVLGIGGVLIAFMSLATALRAERSNGAQEGAVRSLQEHGRQSLAVLFRGCDDEPPTTAS